jgi:hypothetical protein
LPLLFLVAAIVFAACPRHEQQQRSAQPQTQTIAPAAAKPDTSGTDAMTQTVEVDDSRSEEDGGVITNPTSTVKTGAASGTATNKAATKPAAKKTTKKP